VLGERTPLKFNPLSKGKGTLPSLSPLQRVLQHCEQFNLTSQLRASCIVHTQLHAPPTFLTGGEHCLVNYKLKRHVVVHTLSNTIASTSGQICKILCFAPMLLPVKITFGTAENLSGKSSPLLKRGGTLTQKFLRPTVM